MGYMIKYDDKASPSFEINFPDDYEEEIVIIRRKRRASEGVFPTPVIVPEKEPCAFDGWDWERNPVALLYCSCPKCSPRC